VAAAVAAGQAIPVNQFEAERARDIESGAFDLAERIATGQGRRRGEFLRENELSKISGLELLGGSTATGANVISRRLFDPSDPLGEQFKAQSALSRQGFEQQGGLAAQRQGFAVFNAQLGNQLSKNYAEFSMRLKKQYEAWLYEEGLGQYAEQDGGEGILEYLQLGVEAAELIPGVG